MDGLEGEQERPRRLIDKGLLLFLIVTFLADQASKGLVQWGLSPGESVPRSGLFRFTYVTNTGSAFGLFPNQTFLLILASFVGIGVLLLLYRTHPFNGVLLRVSLGLQLGGAIGNLADRVRLGYVVDFIDVGWWPVFNLADSSILIGLSILFWIFLSTRERDKVAEEGELSEEAGGLLSGPEAGGLGVDVEETSAMKDRLLGREGKPWETCGD